EDPSLDQLEIGELAGPCGEIERAPLRPVEERYEARGAKTDVGHGMLGSERLEKVLPRGCARLCLDDPAGDREQGARAVDDVVHVALPTHRQAARVDGRGIYPQACRGLLDAESAEHELTHRLEEHAIEAHAATCAGMRESARCASSRAWSS